MICFAPVTINARVAIVIRVKILVTVFHPSNSIAILHLQGDARIGKISRKSTLRIDVISYRVSGMEIVTAEYV